MPLSIVFMLLIYAVFTKSNVRRKHTAVVILVILYFTSNSYLVTKAFNAWETSAVNLSRVENNYDVGILLSGGLVSGRKPLSDHPSFGDHGDRILQVYQLYKAKKIKKILITGASPLRQIRAGKGESKLAGSLMIQWGVPAEDIMYEERARNTRENALFSSEILNKNYPEGKFLLVTSAFHMRRSQACFTKVGIKTDPFPADYYGGYNKLSFRNGVIPNPEAISTFSVLWREITGFVIYKIIGYS